MKRPCSQACRLEAKYGSVPACETSPIRLVRPTSPNAATTRGGSNASTTLSSTAPARAGRSAGVTQVSACSGPKFSAVDKVVASSPSSIAPSSSTSRLTSWRDITNATQHGAIRPSTMAISSMPGASWPCAVGAGSQPSSAVSASASLRALAARDRPSPRPIGTGGGNSSATGQVSSSARPALPCGTNQRSRRRCQ